MKKIINFALIANLLLLLVFNIYEVYCESRLQLIRDIDQIDFNEPSGIVFHPQRETLFVVGDEGDICEIQTDGTLVKKKRISRADFEGITCNPLTGKLYIAIEGEEKIIEINPENLEILREFYINRTFKDRLVLKRDKENGIEAITFIPDTNNPDGGTFYVANQTLDLTDEQDPSAIFELQVPLKSNSAKKAIIIRHFSLGVIDLSGLHYDEKEDFLYVISNKKNTLFKITKKGKILESYNLPGKDQGGITVDKNGFLYVAQDKGGGIIKLEWFK